VRLPFSQEKLIQCVMKRLNHQQKKVGTNLRILDALQSKEVNRNRLGKVAVKMYKNRRGGTKEFKYYESLREGPGGRKTRLG